MKFFARIKVMFMVTENDSVQGSLQFRIWFNNRRLLEPIGNIPPAEFEES